MFWLKLYTYSSDGIAQDLAAFCKFLFFLILPIQPKNRTLLSIFLPFLYLLVSNSTSLTFKDNVLGVELGIFNSNSD